MSSFYHIFNGRNVFSAFYLKVVNKTQNKINKINKTQSNISKRLKKLLKKKKNPNKRK